MPHQAWPIKPLGDLVTLFDSRRKPLSAIQRSTRQGRFPYYGASGAIDQIDDFRFEGRYLLVAEDGENLRSRKGPVAFFATGRFWVNNHAHVLRAKRGEAIDEFIAHWFAGSNIRSAITGAAQPKLSQQSLKALQVRCPPLPLQRKIAAILSAYDDLIENNRRRIEILEVSARAIYREWFEARRFPGPRDLAETGDELPTGWREVLVGEIVELKYGKALSASHRNLGTVRVMSSAGAVGWHDEGLACGPGIVVGRKGNVGSIHWVQGEYWVIDTAYSVRSDLPLSYLFHALGTLEFRNSHAAVPGLNREDVYTQTMIVPDANILNRFSAIATQSFEMQDALEHQNANLAAQRDLLLPKLISGELDVSELDVDTGRIEEQEKLWRESVSG